MLALDSKSIYWRDTCNGVVFSLAKSGGDPRQLAPFPPDEDECRREESGPEACQYMCGLLAVDDRHVYWPDGNAIMRVAKIRRRGGGGEHGRRGDLDRGGRRDDLLHDGQRTTCPLDVSTR